MSSAWSPVRSTSRRATGLLYVDLDADLTTDETGDGILDWTGVAHLLAIPGTEPAVSGVGKRVPLLGPEDVVLLATNSITDAEREVIDARGVGLERLDAVRR